MADIVDPDNLDPFDPETDKAKRSNAAVKAEVDNKVARTELEQRRFAYTRVFVEGAPTPEDRKLVLNDLHWFCRFMQSAYHDNDRLHALISGRQEVALRIHDFTSLSVDELIVKYTGS